MRTKSSRLITHIRRRISRKFDYIQKNPDITIITNNCLSGFLYTDLRLRYNSPMIGLQLNPKDFIKFCRHFNYYISLPVTEALDLKRAEFSKLGGGKIDFPVGNLGDLTLYFQHYKNMDTAIKKWNERTNRINKQKLFFIFVVDDNVETEILYDYEALNLPNKLLLTNSQRINSASVYALENGDESWFKKRGWFIKKRRYQKFNFIDWFYQGLQK